MRASTLSQDLSLEAFLALPEGETACELVDGATVPKVSPKRFHSKTQKTLLRILDDWCGAGGEVGLSGQWL
jgi:Uma2 family endonuclease